LYPSSGITLLEQVLVFNIGIACAADSPEFQADLNVSNIVSSTGPYETDLTFHGGADVVPVFSFFDSKIVKCIHRLLSHIVRCPMGFTRKFEDVTCSGIQIHNGGTITNESRR
jgi:hypothetical protein